MFLCFNRDFVTFESRTVPAVAYFKIKPSSFFFFYPAVIGFGCLEVFHDVTGCVLQAGPLVRTKIPKDTEGKQKTFGFVVYKHDVSAPYAMQLLDGTSLFGRNIHVQFRSGEPSLLLINTMNSLNKLKKETKTIRF